MYKDEGYGARVEDVEGIDNAPEEKARGITIAFAPLGVLDAERVTTRTSTLRATPTTSRT